jgi:hypothetical protein
LWWKSLNSGRTTNDLDASVEDLPKAQLTFDDTKGMLHFGSEAGFRRLNQVQMPALSYL